MNIESTRYNIIFVPIFRQIPACNTLRSLSESEPTDPVFGVLVFGEVTLSEFLPF